ncbi:Fic family protein [Parasediminibacterium sp. JCM 36343]|uniref:Fic family protein n=1 Tax=Parasediminibacterium sp. JCM 36343 TaxID=3374279 RepID=UPI00397C37FD
MREYEEMKAHDVAFRMVEDWAKETERPLTEQHIKNLNEIILVRPFWKDAITGDGQGTRRQIKIGNYKEYPNSVRLANGELFEYASPIDTPIQMQELIEWYRANENNLHPVALAAMLHYKFVCIHPFDDGNGRIARLLINYVLLKNNLPPIIIKSEDKANYLRVLHLADIGDYESFVNYIGEQAIWSLELSIKAARGESLEEPGDLEKKLYLLKRQLGEDPNSRLQLIYGNDALKNVALNTLVPLAHAWEEKLKNFDTLFISREIEFVKGLEVEKGNFSFIRAESFKFNEINNEFDNFTNGLWQVTLAPLNMEPFLALNCYAKGLRKINNEVSLSGGEITIQFFQNAYELSYSASDSKINKLYHEALTKNEIDTIVSELCNVLYNSIEVQYATKS